MGPPTPGWAQVFLLRNVETSLEKRSSLAQLGKPRVLVWKRDGGGAGCFSTDLAHPTPTPVQVPSPFLSHGTSRGFWGASNLSAPLAWKPALGQAAGGWGLADPGPWIGEGSLG